MTGIHDVSATLPPGELCEELSREPRLVFDFTLPNRKNLPASLLKRGYVSLITFSITVQLGEPEFLPCLRENGVLAAGVPVPEAAVDEYCRVMTFEDDIRAAGQAFATERESKTEAVEQRPDPHLRQGVPSFDAAHVPASALSREPVHILLFGAALAGNPLFQTIFAETSIRTSSGRQLQTTSMFEVACDGD
jgi:hypothetical protein